MAHDEKNLVRSCSDVVEIIESHPISKTRPLAAGPGTIAKGVIEGASIQMTLSSTSRIIPRQEGLLHQGARWLAPLRLDR